MPRSTKLLTNINDPGKYCVKVVINGSTTHYLSFTKTQLQIELLSPLGTITDCSKDVNFAWKITENGKDITGSTNVLLIIKNSGYAAKGSFELPGSDVEKLAPNFKWKVQFIKDGQQITSTEASVNVNCESKPQYPPSITVTPETYQLDLSQQSTKNIYVTVFSQSDFDPRKYKVELKYELIFSTGSTTEISSSRLPKTITFTEAKTSSAKKSIPLEDIRKEINKINDPGKQELKVTAKLVEISTNEVVSTDEEKISLVNEISDFTTAIKAERDKNDPTKVNITVTNSNSLVESTISFVEVQPGTDCSKATGYVDIKTEKSIQIQTNTNVDRNKNYCFKTTSKLSGQVKTVYTYLAALPEPELKGKFEKDIYIFYECSSGTVNWNANGEIEKQVFEIISDNQSVFSKELSASTRMYSVAIPYNWKKIDKVEYTGRITVNSKSGKKSSFETKIKISETPIIEKNSFVIEPNPVPANQNTVTFKFKVPNSSRIIYYSTNENKFSYTLYYKRLSNVNDYCSNGVIFSEKDTVKLEGESNKTENEVSGNIEKPGIYCAKLVLYNGLCRTEAWLKFEKKAEEIKLIAKDLLEFYNCHDKDIRFEWDWSDKDTTQTLYELQITNTSSGKTYTVKTNNKYSQINVKTLMYETTGNGYYPSEPVTFKWKVKAVRGGITYESELKETVVQCGLKLTLQPVEVVECELDNVPLSWQWTGINKNFTVKILNKQNQELIKEQINDTKYIANLRKILENNETELKWVVEINSTSAESTIKIVYFPNFTINSYTLTDQTLKIKASYTENGSVHSWTTSVVKVTKKEECSLSNLSNLLTKILQSQTVQSYQKLEKTGEYEQKIEGVPVGTNCVVSTLCFVNSKVSCCKSFVQVIDVSEPFSCINGYPKILGPEDNVLLPKNISDLSFNFEFGNYKVPMKRYLKIWSDDNQINETYDLTNTTYVLKWKNIYTEKGALKYQVIEKYNDKECKSEVRTITIVDVPKVTIKILEKNEDTQHNLQIVVDEDKIPTKDPKPYTFNVYIFEPVNGDCPPVDDIKKVKTKATVQLSTASKQEVIKQISNNPNVEKNKKYCVVVGMVYRRPLDDYWKNTVFTQNMIYSNSDWFKLLDKPTDIYSGETIITPCETAIPLKWDTDAQKITATLRISKKEDFSEIILTKEFTNQEKVLSVPANFFQENQTFYYELTTKQNEKTLSIRKEKVIYIPKPSKPEITKVEPENATVNQPVEITVQTPDPTLYTTIVEITYEDNIKEEVPVVNGKASFVPKKEGKITLKPKSRYKFDTNKDCVVEGDKREITAELPSKLVGESDVTFCEDIKLSWRLEPSKPITKSYLSYLTRDSIDLGNTTSYTIPLNELYNGLSIIWQVKVDSNSKTYESKKYQINYSANVDFGVAVLSRVEESVYNLQLSVNTVGKSAALNHKIWYTRLDETFRCGPGFEGDWQLLTEFNGLSLKKEQLINGSPKQCFCVKIVSICPNAPHIEIVNYAHFCLPFTAIEPVNQNVKEKKPEPPEPEPTKKPEETPQPPEPEPTKKPEETPQPPEPEPTKKPEETPQPPQLSGELKPGPEPKPDETIGILEPEEKVQVPEPQNILKPDEEYPKAAEPEGKLKKILPTSTTNNYSDGNY